MAKQPTMTTYLLLVFVTYIVVIYGQTVNPNQFEYQYGVLRTLLNVENKANTTELNLHSLTAQLKDALLEIENLNTIVQDLKSTHPTGGSTYTRWGKTTCPDGDSVKVYDGWVGGSHYSHAGSGSNPLCMPKDPLWPAAYNTKTEHKAFVYGTEYELGGQTQDHEAPCAVCWIPRSSSFMLPGRNQCYTGWKLEYHGILVSSHYTHSRTEYVCLDEDFDISKKSSATNHNGHLFYSTEARCGSLPCDTYPDGSELSCTVCSYSPFTNTVTPQPYV